MYKRQVLYHAVPREWIKLRYGRIKLWPARIIAFVKRLVTGFWYKLQMKAIYAEFCITGLK